MSEVACSSTHQTDISMSTGSRYSPGGPKQYPVYYNSSPPTPVQQPSLPSHNHVSGQATTPSSSATKNSNTGHSELLQEVERLRSERTNEQKAYNDFVRAAIEFNRQIHPALRSQAFVKAYEQLENASKGVTIQHRMASKSRPSDRERSTRPTPVSASSNAYIDHQRALHMQLQFMDQIKAKDARLNHIQQMTRGALRSLGNAQTYLHSIVPYQSAQPNLSAYSCALDAHLAAVQNNAATFAEMVSSYVNGRYGVIFGELRPRLMAILEPNFAEPDDCTVLVNAILEGIDKDMMIHTNEVASLTKDLTRPVRDIIDSLHDGLNALVEG